MSDRGSVGGRGLRIVVVDDEVLIADLLVDLLEEAGHEIVGVAATGEHAIDLLCQQRPDFAFLDIRLKGRLTGMDVAVEARRQAVPFAYVTGSGDPETRRLAQATDPIDILQKPFNQARLLDVLRKVIMGS